MNLGTKGQIGDIYISRSHATSRIHLTQSVRPTARSAELDFYGAQVDMILEYQEIGTGYDG